MKKSDLYIRITTAVLFIAVIAYIGVYVYNAVMKTYETTPALSYTVEQSFHTQGYIVRTERVLTDVGSAVMPIVGEGEKVASGQAIAVEYTSRDAIEMASEIRALKLMIAQLESAGNPGAAEAANLKSILELSAAASRGDFAKLDELSLRVETYIFTGDAAARTDLPALKARLETLESRISGVRTIYAPVSGTFSHVVDGYEHIGPGALADIMPSALEALFDVPSRTFAAGKLVTEFKWYYAAEMDAADALRIQEGRYVTIQFTGAYNAAAEMLVERVGRRIEGRCVVLFSSDRGVHELTQLRHMRADVVYGVVTGIRVPREALHLDDNGVTFIYLQTGVSAERVDVEILLESGDSYIVRDGLENGTPLRAGSTIIVKANNLYHGKIVA